MPFVDENTLPTRGFLPGRSDVLTQPEADFFEEVVPTAFRLENTVGSLANRGSIGGDGDIDPDFDPFGHIPEGMEQFASRYRTVNSILEADRVTEAIERELDAKQLLSDAGAEGFAATMAAGVFDPVNFIPVGGAAYRTYRMSGHILENAYVTARAGFVGVAAAEGILQQSQLARTESESALNVAAGTFLAGVLGGSMGAVRVAIDGAGSGRFTDMLEQVDRDLTLDINDSVGAARSVQTTLEQEGVKTNPAVAAALKAVGKQDPLLRLLGSASRASRAVIQDLAETPLVLGKNEIGEATPRSVERLVRNWQAPLYRSLKGLDDQFHAYSTGQSGQRRFGGVVAAEIRSRAGNGRLTGRQFREEVGKAMRRGDEHEIPEVAAAARMMRKEVFDPLKEEAIAAKLLPEDVDPVTAVSYLNRVYNLQKLATNRTQFIDTTSEWLMRRRGEADSRSGKLASQIGELEARIEAGERDLQSELMKLKDKQSRDNFDLEMTRDDAIDIAEQIAARIEGTPAGRLPYDVTVPTSRRRGKNDPNLSRPLKGRAFLIEDELIEDFLESDVEVLAKLFVRGVAPDVELTKKFGDLEMTDVIDNIRREHEPRIQLAKNRKASEAAVRARDNDIRDIMAVRDRIRGVYGMPDDPKALNTRIGRAIRQLNYTRLLGGMTLSAIPDLARAVMVHGFSRTFNDALVPMVKNWKTFSANARQLRDMGAATDMVMNSRAKALADIEDDFGRFTKFERALGAANDTFGMVSLMAPWNTALKQIVGTMSQTRLLRAMQADVAGKIGKKELEYLRSAGISADDARIVLKQFDEHGGIEDGIYAPNANAWTDRDAYVALQSAVNRDVDRIIVTPGQDLPLAATGAWGEIGRMAFQFKSFAIASTQRMMLAGLQQRDLAALNGLMLSTALGMVSYAVKQKDANRPISDDPKVWLREGIDRSGVTGWFFEANNMLEKATRGTVGVSALTGGPPMSRYASRNMIGAILGPTAGTISGLASVSQNVSAATLGDEPLKASDIHAARRLLPYNNLLGFRQLVDQAEEGVASVLGAK